MQNNNPGFFDQKTLLAVISVALIYGGWQYYLAQKYPSYGKRSETVSESVNPTSSPDSSKMSSKAVDPETSQEIQNPNTLVEEKFFFSGNQVRFEVSSLGMGLRNVTLLKYTDKNDNEIVFADNGRDLFSLELVGSQQKVPFNVSEISPGQYRGEAKIGEMIIQREMQYDEKLNSFSNKVTVINPDQTILKGIAFSLPDKIKANPSSSILFPSYDLQDFFVVHGSEIKETININHASENFNKDFKIASTVAVGSQYFTSALLDKSELLPNVSLSADVGTKEAIAKVTYLPPQLSEKLQFQQVLYVGPKSIDQLKLIDSSLAKIVDFGFFDFIATPLLYVMKFFYSMVGNWGFAIILLTLMVRLVVLPLHIMSFKSMKAMQKIQPAVKVLREKYKDDPMRMNQEMMSLMKDNGANPIGGCLPMLLQIPVFFALYRVISSSVELYQSPFMLWITDLSAYDKFYVLPVLMGASIFIQQKMTPTTMDPMQAKIMLALPVIMSLFMLQLPSGLTLYMFVSTLFGIIQQLIIMREPKPVQ